MLIIFGLPALTGFRFLTGKISGGGKLSRDTLKDIALIFSGALVVAIICSPCCLLQEYCNSEKMMTNMDWLLLIEEDQVMIYINSWLLMPHFATSSIRTEWNTHSLP